MSSTAVPPPSAGSVPPPPAPSWTRRLTKIVGIVVAIVLAGIAIINFGMRNELPGCDSARAKDTLSNIFKERDVKATRYDSIDMISKTDEEIKCHASLTLEDGAKLQINCRLFKESGEMRLLITDAVDEAKP